MGITDEDYAKQLEKLQQLRVEVEKLHKPRMITGTTVGALNYPTQEQQPLGIKPLRGEDLHHEAMKAPLSSLANMWTMRWGNDWVSEQEFMDDDFWRLTLIRLLGANKLEKHNLINQYHSVYRILE
jgi:hypothetical protein